MLMRVKNETFGCYTDDCDKPNKYSSDWERTLWETYSYRNPSEDCDTKRTGPCKISKNTEIQSTQK